MEANWSYKFISRYDDFGAQVSGMAPVRDEKRVSRSHKGWSVKSRTGFGRLCSLCMALFGLSVDIFEIPRVLAICRHQKIQN